MRPLVRDGDIQARELACKIKTHIDDMNIQTIISSDLPRAYHTALPCAQALGIPVMKAKEWRETNNGKLAGMLNKEAQRRYPGIYWSALEPEQRYPGGESPIEFYKRISHEFSILHKKVVDNEFSSNVMVFTHSGVISIIYSIVYGIKWTNKTRSFDIPYTSVHSFNVEHNTITHIL